MIDDKDWLRISRIDYFADIDEDGGTANQLYNLLPNHDSPIAALGFTGEVAAGFGDDVQSHGLYARSYPSYRVFNFIDGKPMLYPHTIFGKLEIELSEMEFGKI